MAPKRFKTDGWLWLFVSLVLFVPPWFLLHIGKAADNMRAADLFRLFLSEREGQVSILWSIVAFALFFGIPALAIGWVIHCAIVFVRERLRNA